MLVLHPTKLWDSSNGKWEIGLNEDQKGVFFYIASEHVADYPDVVNGQIIYPKGGQIPEYVKVKFQEIYDPKLLVS